MLRLSTAVVVAVFALSVSVRAEEKVADPGETAPDNRTLQAQLDRTLPDVTFEGVGLADTIDFLRDITNTNIFVNWRALEPAGIKRNAPVTATLKQVKFGKALQLLLDDVAGGKNKLSFGIDEGVITISTTKDLGKNTSTRVYDVRDIIYPAAKDGAAAVDEKRLKLLTELIVGTVDPKSWGDQGGESGAIRELSGQLIIKQTQDNQTAIINLLRHVRNLIRLERGLPQSELSKEAPPQKAEPKP